MDQLVSFEALLIPSDGRNPHMVPLMTSPTSMPDAYAPHSGLPVRLPHPEVYMDYIAEGLGPRAWNYHVCRAIDPSTLATHCASTLIPACGSTRWHE